MWAVVSAGEVARGDDDVREEVEVEFKEEGKGEPLLPRDSWVC